MCLIGILISAQRAYDIGLINYVVPKEQVLEKAIELAKTIAANAPISLRLTKEIFHITSQVSEEDAQRFCNVCWDYIEKMEDAIKDPKAFCFWTRP